MIIGQKMQGSAIDAVGIQRASWLRLIFLKEKHRKIGESMQNEQRSMGSSAPAFLSSGRENMRWLLICPAIFMFWAVANIDKVGISVVAANADFIRDIGIGGRSAAIGALMTAFTVTYGLSSFMWGYLIDKMGPRKIAVVGVLLWAASLIVGGLASRYDQVLLSRLILGLGEGMIFPLTNKYIAAWFCPRELGKAQASWVCGAYLGPALGLPVLVSSIHTSGWHHAFYLLAAIALLVNLPLMLFVTRDTPESHPWVRQSEVAYIRQGAAVHSEKIENSRFLKDPQYWMVCAAFLVLAALFYGITFWMPTYLQSGRGFSPAETKAALSFSWLFAVVAVLVNGHLADRTRRPALVAVCVFLICGAALIAAPMQSHKGATAVLLGLALGCTASELALNQMMLVKLAVPKNTGKAAGVIGILNVLGGSVPALMGWIVDSTRGNFDVAFVCLAAAPFGGMLACAGLAHAERQQLARAADASASAH